MQMTGRGRIGSVLAAFESNITRNHEHHSVNSDSTNNTRTSFLTGLASASTGGSSRNLGKALSSSSSSTTSSMSVAPETRKEHRNKDHAAAAKPNKPAGGEVLQKTGSQRRLLSHRFMRPRSLSSDRRPLSERFLDPQQQKQQQKSPATSDCSSTSAETLTSQTQSPPVVRAVMTTTTTTGSSAKNSHNRWTTSTTTSSSAAATPRRTEKSRSASVGRAPVVESTETTESLTTDEDNSTMSHQQSQRLPSTTTTTSRIVRVAVRKKASTASSGQMMASPHTDPTLSLIKSDLSSPASPGTSSSAHSMPISHSQQMAIKRHVMALSVAPLSGSNSPRSPPKRQIAIKSLPTTPMTNSSKKSPGGTGVKRTKASMASTAASLRAPFEYPSPLSSEAGGDRGREAGPTRSPSSPEFARDGATLPASALKKKQRSLSAPRLGGPRSCLKQVGSPKKQMRVSFAGQYSNSSVASSRRFSGSGMSNSCGGGGGGGVVGGFAGMTSPRGDSPMSQSLLEGPPRPPRRCSLNDLDGHVLPLPFASPTAGDNGPRTCLPGGGLIDVVQTLPLITEEAMNRTRIEQRRKYSAVKIEARVRGWLQRMKYRVWQLEKQLQAVEQQRKEDLQGIQRRKWAAMEQMRRDYENQQSTLQQELERSIRIADQVACENTMLLEESKVLAASIEDMTRMNQQWEDTAQLFGSSTTALNLAVDMLREKNSTLLQCSEKYEYHTRKQRDRLVEAGDVIRYETNRRQIVERHMDRVVSAVKARCLDEGVLEKIVALSNGEALDECVNYASDAEDGFSLTLATNVEEDISVVTDPMRSLTILPINFPPVHEVSVEEDSSFIEVEVKDDEEGDGSGTSSVWVENHSILL